MMDKKKNKGSEAGVADEKMDKAIDELAEAVAANEGNSRSLEPFDQYVQRVKLNMFSDLHTFRTRFSRGYKVLLEELSKASQSK